ncbi:hypothetical protein HDG34_002593 [Paraburkholderia sp. HC6.4b]|nr:hypothetical protein [Paraburkholderia sp. HC6.4b]
MPFSYTSVTWPPIFVTWSSRLVIKLVFWSTCWFVAYSCEPFTASVLVSLSAPAFTPLSVRAPSVPPKSTVVPSRSLATVMFRVAASCCTRPIVPSFRLLVTFVMSPLIFVMSALLIAMSLLLSSAMLWIITRPSLRLSINVALRRTLSSMLANASPTLLTVVPPTL